MPKFFAFVTTNGGSTNRTGLVLHTPIRQVVQQLCEHTNELAFAANEPCLVAGKAKTVSACQCNFFGLIHAYFTFIIIDTRLFLFFLIFPMTNDGEAKTVRGAITNVYIVTAN